MQQLQSNRNIFNFNLLMNGFRLSRVAQQKKSCFCVQLKFSFVSAFFILFCCLLVPTSGCWALGEAFILFLFNFLLCSSMGCFTLYILLDKRKKCAF